MANNKKRSTRRAFGRRALAFGVAMFAMVTLTAVGFAAWLISTNSTATAPGGIVTQEVRVQNIKVTVKNVNDSGKLVDLTKEDRPEYEITFAPQDVAGLITFDDNGGNDKPENLKFSFNGEIENWDRVGELNFSVRVPDSIVTAAGLTKSGSTWTFDANKAYIKLPSYAMAKDGTALPNVGNSTTWDGVSMTAPVSFTNISDTGAVLESADLDGDTAITTDKITITAPVTGSTATFAGIDLAFGWGARYSYNNPSATLNTDNWTNISATGIEKDKAYTTNQIQLELIKLEAVVNKIALDNSYFNTVKLTAEGTETLAQAMTAASASTIEDFAKTSDAQKWLTALQASVTSTKNATGFEKPTYNLFIEAKVRS